MPIYHFNVHDRLLLPDKDGRELPDLDAAKREAISRSGDMIKELDAALWHGEEWKMDVTDSTGLILFSLVFFATAAPTLAQRQATPPIRIG